MGAEEAQRVVLSWLDPARRPRIEEAFYVSEGEVNAVAPAEGPYAWFAPDEMMYFETPFPAAGSSRLLLVVVASSQGMDVFHMAGQHPGGEPSSSNLDLVWPGATCVSVPASRRQKLLAMFDAATGQQVGAGPVCDPELDKALIRLAGSGRSQLSGATPLPSPTPTIARTPGPTPTNLPLPDLPADAAAARPLAYGEVPQALVDVLREFPLVHGAQWVYRVTGHTNNVHWSRHVITSTIDAAWQIAPDVMIVHERQEITAGGSLPWYNTPSRYWFVFPEGIAGSLGDATLATAGAELATPPPPTASLDSPWPELPIREALRVPIRSPERVDYWREMQREEPMTVPAGSFPSCVVVRDILNAGNSSASWLCRGAGYVRHEYPACTTMSGGHRTLVLVRYTIPWFRPVSKQR